MPKDDILGTQTLLTSECFNTLISMHYTMLSLGIVTFHNKEL